MIEVFVGDSKLCELYYIVLKKDVQKRHQAGRYTGNSTQVSLRKQIFFMVYHLFATPGRFRYVTVAEIVLRQRSVFYLLYRSFLTIFFSVKKY